MNRVIKLASRIWLLQYGPSSLRLFPLEKRLLEELCVSLPTALAEQVKNQLQIYNLFQRDGNHQRLDFYFKLLWRVTFPEALRLSVPARELRLMKVTFRLRREDVERHVVFWSVNRRLSLMSFDDSYRAIREERDILVLKKISYGGAESGAESQQLS